MLGSLMLDIAGTWLTAEDRRLLRQPEVGGLILFARNIEHPQQVRELCAAIRALRPDLLLAVDQEGGRVQRLRNGFVRLPSMQALAAAPDAARLAEHCGWLMASEVLAAGLDFSFAPVLDLDHGRSTVIGSRSFGSDPLYVRLCTAQQCFRARLTPKPWRCDAGKPPARFPFPDGAAELRYREWVQHYEQASQPYAVCRLLGDYGAQTRHPVVTAVLDVHDRYTRPGVNRQLA